MGRKRTKPPKGTDREILLDRIRQAPGLGLANFRSACNPHKFETIYQPLLAELESEGAVFQHQFPWSDTLFWYEAGYPVEKLFQPASTKHGEIKTYTDPFLKGAWQPDADQARRAIAKHTIVPDNPKPQNAMQPNINPFTGDDQPKVSKKPVTSKQPNDDSQAEIDRFRQKQGESSSSGKRSSADIRTAIRNALSLMVEKGDLWTMAYVCKRAAAAGNYFNNNPGMRLEYEEAMREVQRQRVPGDTEAWQALDAVNQELDAYDRLEQAAEGHTADPETVEAEIEVLEQSITATAKQAIEAAEWQAKLSAQCVVELAAEKDQLEQRLQALGERLDRFEQVEQRLQETEQRNYELRQQIARLQEQKQQPQFVEVAISANHYQQQAEAWRATVAELEADLAHAQKTQAAFEHLAAINVVSQPIDLTKVNAQLNGNGKAVLEATHDS